MFVADVFTKLPKGNVRVSVSDSSMGPVVTEVKGYVPWPAPIVHAGPPAGALTKLLTQQEVIA